MVKLGKEILILHDGNVPFLLMSVKNKFISHNWKVVESGLDFKEIEKKSDFPGLILGQAEDYNRHKDSLVFLADQCIQSGSKLIVLGNPEDLEEFKGSVSPSVIIATFVRPIDVNDLVENINVAYEQLSDNLTRKKILVVDDSPVFLRTMMEWLNGKYQVSVAPNVAAAFNVINQNSPDLILLDYEMPVCTGAKFLEMLKSEAKTDSVPVIFLTSRGDAETVREVLSLKPQGYLLKTQPKDAILNTIEEFFLHQSLKN